MIDVYDGEFGGEPERFYKRFATVDLILEEIGITAGEEERLREAIAAGQAIELCATFEGDPPVIIRYPADPAIQMTTASAREW